MNQLAAESSPYLRQHAENPVDWLAWGDAAFQLARERDVPVLLSVGYSACHWCHVMAHESFEDPEIAAVMNRDFVNIKVDREERPDVDAIYMQAVQALTGRGGWPMTVFLDTDARPFYGGTYFPPEPRHGMPGFVQVLDAIADAWRHRRDELDEQAQRLHDAITRSTTLEAYSLEAYSLETSTDETSTLDVESDGATSQGATSTQAGHEYLAATYAGIRAAFDPEYGGFGQAPKFPQAMTLDVLMNAWVRNSSDETLSMVTTSLDRMAAGGLYDQIGGGFHRYSVDRWWLVPHFEKMLYDQALLVRAYLHGYLATGTPRYRRVVEDTIDYVLRELRLDGGGFASAEDADSEGVEGKFYVWSLDDVRTIGDGIGPGVADAVEAFFGVTEGGNFEGTNILFAVDPSAERPDAVRQAIPALFAERERRVRPGLDDKVLTAWNALFASALAEAGAALGRDDWIEAARTNIEFLLTQLRQDGGLRDDGGRVLRSWHDGRASIPGYAEDYAALLEALVTLAETDDIAHLDDARIIADAMIALFADDATDGAGFFTTGSDTDDLIVRPRSVEDNAVPSENSLAANGLLRLSALTGDTSYGDRATAWLGRIGAVSARHPTAFAYALAALERAVSTPLEIAIVGADGTTDELRAVAYGRLIPAAVRVSARPGYGSQFTPLLVDRDLIDERPTAYVCEGFTCEVPTTDADALGAQIDAALEAR